MATSDKEQKGIDVRQHKRLAMGEKIDGTSLQSKGSSSESKHKSGGLSHIGKKNK
jgi:hypothetical protein